MAENENENETTVEKKLPIIVKLRKPIRDQNDKEITEIKIDREPTAGDFADFNFNNQTTDGFLRAISKLTGIQLPFLRRMHFGDAKAVIEEIAAFL